MNPPTTRLTCLRRIRPAASRIAVAMTRWMGGAALAAAATLALPPAQAATQPEAAVPAAAAPVDAAAPGSAQQPVMPPEDMRKAAEQAFWWGDFAELERLYQLALQPGPLVEEGHLMVAVFRNGAFRVFNHNPASEQYHLNLVALTQRWAREHPQSALAHMLHVRARYALAWWYRGDGYANTVSAEMWALFKQHIDAAIEHLGAHAEVSLQHSTAYSYALMLGRSAGWDRARLVALVDAGLRLAPKDFGLHQSMLTSLLPKWGGSEEAIDSYIDWAADKAGPEHGHMVYARLYNEVAGEFQQDLFTRTRAQWPRMKLGWDQLVERFPTDNNINRYALLACLARDKPVLASLLERIGNAPNLRAWGHNAGRTLDGCRRLAREPDKPQEPPAPAAPRGPVASA